LAAIWAELLKVERVGRHDSFFELGGHSLLALGLVERMRRQGLHADVKLLFSSPTVAELALSVATVAKDIVVPPNLIPPGATSITPEMLTLARLDQAGIDRVVAMVEGGAAQVQDLYPLTAAQEGILFHHRMGSGSDAYVEAGLLACSSRERVDSFLQALQQLVDRHDILRTAILWEGLDEPLQVVHRRAALPVSFLDLDPADGEVAQQLAQRMDPRRTRIDVRQPPMLRVGVAHDPVQGRWLMRLLSHHLVMDHTTQELLIQEAGLIQAGRADQLLPPVPFRDFVARARLGVSDDEHRAFFSRMLGDVEEPTAPFEILETEVSGLEMKEARLPLPASTARAVRELARRFGVSVASVMHLAWAMVIAKVSSRQSPVFGTVLFGRMQGGPGADRVWGMFINTLPVRIDVDAAPVQQSLRRVHALLSELLHHEHASLALAQRCSGVRHGQPLFTSLLNYRYGVFEEQVQAHNAELEVLGAEERSSFPICLDVDDLGEGFSLNAQVEGGLDPLRVCRLMEASLDGLLQALREAPQTPVAHIDILPAAEREQVLRGWNQTQEALPLDRCVHELIEAQVRRDGAAA
ncbi:condensation domain-containing protein, partial [Roseateles flavus]